MLERSHQDRIKGIRQQQPANAASLRVQLLGGFHVWVGQGLIPDTVWHRRKAAALVKVLALAPEHRLHREEVLELLWPELPPGAGENNLHRTLHIVRHALQPDLPTGAPSRYLALQGELLVLCPDVELQVDVAAFMQAAHAARQSEDPAASETAIKLYTGDLLPEDQYEDWVTARREELQRTYHDLLHRLSRLYEGQGRYRQAIEVVQRLVGSEPVDEGAQASLMRLYALSGQRQEALEQYERLRDILQQEVGAEPDASTRRLVEDIRTGCFPNESSPSAANEKMAARTAPARTGSDPDANEVAESPVPTNLPHHLSSFVGREQDMAEVKRLLSSARLLTLAGTGGVGKSRLALELAEEMLAAHPDGVWLVQLAGVADPRLVPQAVARVVGAQEQPDRSVTAVLVDFLRPRQLLLILDNCEHLLDACAQLAETLLERCPHLRILTTSRRILGISGEVAWRVPSLAIPASEPHPLLDSLVTYDAISLFLERTRSVRPDFTLTEQNALAVVDICRRLDGIPLAIELAAARMRVLTVEQLAQRLDDCFSALGGGSTDPLSRNSTLQSTMDWSHELLSECERVLFRRLGIFAGGWALEAAEEVCSGGEIGEREVLDLLSRLVDHSLVLVAKQGRAMRYRLLEPVRQDALRRLRIAGEEQRLRQRHTAWCLVLAEAADAELAGSDQLTTLEQLEWEHDNLRAALHWLAEQGDGGLGLQLAGGLWRFWWLHGHWSEGRRWTEAMLDRRAPDENGPVRARALSGAGVLASSQGDQARAAALHDEALALYRAVGDIRGVATALCDLGRVAHYRADFKCAAALYAESLALRRELDDRPAVALSLLSLASVERDQGSYERAVALAEESLELYRDLGDHWGTALALNDVGRVARVWGEYRRAESLHEESLNLYRQLGDERGIAIGVHNLGCVAQEQGDLARAEALHEECLRLYQHLGDEWGIAGALHQLARDAYYRDYHRHARELAEESLLLRRRLRDTWGIAHALLTLGRIARAAGEPGRAIALYKESLTLYQKVGDRVGLAACLEGLAGAMIEVGEAVPAAGLFGAASALRAALGTPLPPVDRASHEREVAVIHARLGEDPFGTAWEEGQSTPLQEVVAEALSWDAIDRVGRDVPEASRVGDEHLSLSPREREVAALVAQGLTNSRIAAELQMSEQTAAVHVRNILKKLGFASRKDITLWATGQSPVPRDTAQQKRVGRPRTLPGRTAS